MVVDVTITFVLLSLCVGGMEVVRRWLVRGATDPQLSRGALILLRIISPAPLAVLLQLFFVDILSKPRINIAGSVDWWLPAGMALLGAYALCLLPIDRWGYAAGTWLSGVSTQRRPRRVAFDNEFEQLFGR